MNLVNSVPLLFIRYVKKLTCAQKVTQSRRKDPPHPPVGGGLTHAQGPHVV